MRRRLFAITLPLLLLVACAEPPAPATNPDQLLLDRFTVLGDAPVERIELCEKKKRVDFAEIQSACAEQSRRPSLLTRGDVVQEVEIDPTTEAEIEFHLAGASGAGTAIVESAGPHPPAPSPEAGEGESDWEVLWSGSPGETWERVRVAVRAGTSRLRLRSDGDSPVFWSEIQLLGDDLPEQPDLILVILDTLRADRLSGQGYDRLTSPNFDRLAKSSLHFPRSYSSSTWTLPSTATLLTGLLPLQHGAKSIKNRVSADIDTVAERLQAAGYRTAAITDGGLVRARVGFDQGFGRFDTTPGKAWDPKDAAVIVEQAKKWLDENDFHPFFLVVHTYETHQPYLDPERFAEPFLDPDYEGRYKRQARIQPAEMGDLSADDLRRLNDLYDGEVRRADHYLGELLDMLEESEDAERTALLLTSDHGEEFDDHGDFEHAKGRVYDANVRVPMLLRPPGGVDGRTIEAPVSSVDVVPTLLDLAGVERPEEMIGDSLLALAEQELERPIFVHGLNSVAKLDEERYRLDHGPIAIVYDRRRDELGAFEHESDPGFERPLDFTRDDVREALAHLQSTLAWMAPSQFGARLPEGASRLIVSTDSRVRPLGAWDGITWLGASAPDAEWSVELTPGMPHVLLFDRREDADEGWVVQVETADGVQELRFGGREAASWRPLRGELPAPTSIFTTAAAYRAEEGEISEQQAEELRALGYL